MDANRATINQLIHKKILLVDDASFVRNIIAQLIKNLNITQVYKADDGLEALSVLKHHDIDLLITDIQMPKMNGIELIKQIRLGNTAADRGLSTIVETSFSNTEVIASCLALDINGFLVKPFTIELVTKQICRAFTEERTLQPAENYLHVKTDLDSLAQQTAPTPTRSRPHTLSKPGQGSAVSLTSLEPGMVLLENIYTESGIIMLAAGTKLTESLINRMYELSRVIGNKRITVSEQAD